MATRDPIRHPEGPFYPLGPVRTCWVWPKRAKTNAAPSSHTRWRQNHWLSKGSTFGNGCWEPFGPLGLPRFSQKIILVANGRDEDSQNWKWRTHSGASSKGYCAPGSLHPSTPVQSQGPPSFHESWKPEVFKCPRINNCRVFLSFSFFFFLLFSGRAKESETCSERAAFKVPSQFNRNPRTNCTATNKQNTRKWVGGGGSQNKGAANCFLEASLR